MLFEWQVFSSLAKAVVHSTVIFSFHCSLLFYASSKILCRHKRGTKSQHESLYKKKSTSLQSKTSSNQRLGVRSLPVIIVARGGGLIYETDGDARRLA